MSCWPAPSPPRFVTAREDGAHWGGRAPVHFQVCSPYTKHHQKAKRGFRDVRWVSIPPGVRTHLRRMEEVCASHYTTPI